MAALILKQIERGSVTFTGPDTGELITVTLTTTLTDVAKTVLLFTVSSSSSNGREYLVIGRVLSTTQIQFERDLACISDAVVYYQVKEFTQGITVQHLSFAASSNTINTTISAVTLSKSFVILNTRHSGNNFDETDTAVCEITTTTNLQTRNTSSSASKITGVQVIEIDDATVQAFVTTYGTGATKDITVTTIDSAKTLWFFSLDYAGATLVDIYGYDLPYLSYVNSTTLRFTRAGAANIDWSIVLYVVSLSSGVSVQNISTVIASSGNTVSPTIPTAITVANTSLLLNGMFQTHASININNDDGGGFAFNLSGLTTTQFTATRVDSPALAATTNVQVLEWVGYFLNIILIQDNV